MSRAFSMPKADRNFDASAKKNKALMNVGPGSYALNLADKKAEPKFSMGMRL